MRLFWAAWLFLFLCGEGYALFNRQPGDTLSETVWNWFDVMPGRTFTTWTITHFLLFFFMVWLTGHLVFAWWRKF